MAGGEVILTDVANDEEAGFSRRTIDARDTAWIDIHAGREARWHEVDVLGARPIVVLSVLKRVLCANGFTTRLVWGRPDMRRSIFRAPRPQRCRLRRQQMLTVAHVQALGLEAPDAEPLMHRWATSACHAAVVDYALAPEPWVHGWDAEHPGLLAQVFVEWETTPNLSGRTYMPLSGALKTYGPQAVVMYLLSTGYGELLPPLYEGLRMAREHVRRIEGTVRRLCRDEPSPPELAGHVQAFEDALSKDLDTPGAFLAMFDWIREANALRHPAGDGDLRRMLWMLGMTPPRAVSARDASASRTAGTARSAHLSGDGRASAQKGREGDVRG